MTEARHAEEDHLPTHVSVCQERYKGINARLRRIEKIGGTAIMILILQLLAIIASLLGILFGTGTL